MATAVKPLDDAPPSPFDASGVGAVKLAPDAILQLLQLVARLGYERLRLTADLVVGTTGRGERGAGTVELWPVRGVVVGLLLDAGGLAFEVVQEARITVGAPFVIPLVSSGTALTVGHLVLLKLALCIVRRGCHRAVTRTAGVPASTGRIAS